MFDSRQTKAGKTIAAKLDIPVLYLTQLLGLAMGIRAEKLGLELNLSPVEKIQLGDVK
jgi:heterodisulfide reductase subunit B